MARLVLVNKFANDEEVATIATGTPEQLAAYWRKRQRQMKANTAYRTVDFGPKGKFTVGAMYQAKIK